MSIHKIGILGLDHWYSSLAFIRNMVARNDIVVARIFDSNPERVYEQFPEFDRTKISAEIADVLSDPKVDIVVSFLNPRDNEEACIAAANAKKHIISAKPVALTTAGASRVYDAVAAAHVRFFPSESKWREKAEYRVIHDLASSGRLGKILSASFRAGASLPQAWPTDSSLGWFGSLSTVPGGGWIDHGIYQTDLLRWITGQEPVAVGGISKHLAHGGLEVEDYGAATIEFDQGAVATVECSWLYTGSWYLSLSVVGTDGLVSFETQTNRVTYKEFGNRGNTWNLNVGDAAPHYAGGIDPLLRAIEEGDVLADASDARRNLETCLSFYQSAASGGEVVSLDDSLSTSRQVSLA